MIPPYTSLHELRRARLQRDEVRSFFFLGFCAGAITILAWYVVVLALRSVF